MQKVDCYEGKPLGEALLEMLDIALDLLLSWLRAKVGHVLKGWAERVVGEKLIPESKAAEQEANRRQALIRNYIGGQKYVQIAGITLSAVEAADVLAAVGSPVGFVTFRAVQLRHNLSQQQLTDLALEAASIVGLEDFMLCDCVVSADCEQCPRRGKC